MLFGDGASGQVHAYVRPISQRLSSPLATMGVRLRVGHQTAARALGHNCSSGIARSASTTDFPITRNGTSCRISKLMFDIRVPPSLLGTSRRGDLAGSRAYDGAYGVWTVVFPRIISAQAMRATLLAKATVASRTGRRPSTPRSQAPAALFH